MTIFDFCKEKMQIFPPQQRAKLFFLGGLGIALLLIPSMFQPAAKEDETALKTVDLDAAFSWEEQQEKRLEELICQVEGVGNAHVMITLECEEDTVYATNTRKDNDSLQEETVLLQNNSRALIETVWTPQVQGVAVVCQGADNTAVEVTVTNIVSVLLGVSTNRISIAKMN